MAWRTKNDNGLLKDVLNGMIGGAISTVALEQVAHLMYKFESEEKKKQEESIRKEMPTEVLAERISGGVFGFELSDKTKSKLGQVIHWGTGIAFGGLYGALHDRVPVLSKAAGLPYGAAFALTVDEGLNTALKLTPPPQAFPIDAHVRGFVAPLAYAATADGVFHLLRKVAG